MKKPINKILVVSALGLVALACSTTGDLDSVGVVRALSNVEVTTYTTELSSLGADVSTGTHGTGINTKDLGTLEDYCASSGSVAVQSPESSDQDANKPWECSIGAEDICGCTAGGTGDLTHPAASSDQDWVQKTSSAGAGTGKRIR